MHFEFSFCHCQTGQIMILEQRIITEGLTYLKYWPGSGVLSGFPSYIMLVIPYNNGP